MRRVLIIAVFMAIGFPCGGTTVSFAESVLPPNSVCVDIQLVSFTPAPEVQTDKHIPNIRSKGVTQFGMTELSDLRKKGTISVMVSLCLVTNSGTEAVGKVVSEVVCPIESKPAPVSPPTKENASTRSSAGESGQFEMREVGFIVHATPTALPDGRISVELSLKLDPDVIWRDHYFAQREKQKKNSPEIGPTVFQSIELATKVLLDNGKDSLIGLSPPLQDQGLLVLVVGASIPD